MIFNISMLIKRHIEVEDWSFVRSLARVDCTWLKARRRRNTWPFNGKARSAAGYDLHPG